MPKKQEEKYKKVSKKQKKTDLAPIQSLTEIGGQSGDYKACQINQAIVGICVSCEYCHFTFYAGPSALDLYDHGKHLSCKQSPYQLLQHWLITEQLDLAAALVRLMEECPEFIDAMEAYATQKDSGILYSP